MPVLILVKHSLPEIDPAVPSREWRLSEEGRVRSRILAGLLDQYDLDVVFSSNEPKAVETASTSARRLHVPVEVVEGLHEHERSNVGFLEKDQFEQSIARFFSRPAELVFGEETADAAYDRFSEAVNGVSDRFPQANVALVTHGTVLSLLVSRALALEPFATWKRLGLPSFIALSRPGFDLVETCWRVEGTGPRAVE